MEPNICLQPVEEIIHEEEFTGRRNELHYYEDWIKNIGRGTSESTALIAPRRIGKTVLLDKLVNIVFSRPEYKVAPFYFKVTREEISLRRFLLEYATTFFRQYIAYCLEDPFLYRDRGVKLKGLLKIKSAHHAVKTAQHYIEVFNSNYYEGDIEENRNHWESFIVFPETIASLTGIRVAVIIDEFQDMKSYIFDTDNMSMGAVDLTATYDRQALSRKAPMLVSGSAVTLIFRTVMGGPLGGRFAFRYLSPLSIEDGATLMSNLIRIYNPDHTISTENAIYASTQVGGHPYYLYCIATSASEEKSFYTKDSIDALIDFEITKGKIYGFWRTHFEENREIINMDNDTGLGKKIVYYFTKYNNKAVDSDEIAKKLGVDREEVNRKIEKLYEAHIVYKSDFKNYAFNDICLMRFLQHRYRSEIDNVEEVNLSRRREFNRLKGKFLEVVVANIMLKFRDEVLNGEYFGKAEQVKLPRMQVSEGKYFKGERTGEYSIDVYGREKAGNGVWLVECKNRRAPVGIEVLKKLEKAQIAVTESRKEDGLQTSGTVLWIISLAGFTGEALAYAGQRDYVYLTEHEGINKIFRYFGGGYDIPVFLA